MGYDNASLVKYREPKIDTDSFRRLRSLAHRYAFKIIIVPYCYREGELGRAGVNRTLENALVPYPEFRVVGDDYCLLDARYFSDTRHLNPEGARIYTSIIATLMRTELDAERSASAL